MLALKPLQASRFKLLYYGAVAGFVGLLALFLSISAQMLPGGRPGPADLSADRAALLSSQVTAFAAAYAEGDLSARKQLTDSINALVTLAPAVTSPGSSPQLLQIFILRAQAIANHPPGAPVPGRLLAGFIGAAGGWAGAEQAAAEARHARQMAPVRRAVITFQATVFGLLLLMVSAQTLWLFRPLIERMNVYTDEIVRLATTDALTGLANRRGFIERGEIEHFRSKRYSRPLSLLMLDADYFKRVNDTYGHEAGDQVLRSLARSFLQTLRQSDVVARLGGEEFAVLLPETDLNSAVYVAERIRIKVASTPIKFNQQDISVTLSIGATTLTGKAGIEAALAEADELMYRAKSAGRNRVVASAVDSTGFPIQFN